jgi:transposase
VRAPLPVHLPLERIVLLSPTGCRYCGDKLAKPGETNREKTPECVPRSYKVIHTVREKWSCRARETISQPMAPFHPIVRGDAGPNLLAAILHATFGENHSLNRQSESFAQGEIDLDVSTLADWFDACAGTLAPLVALIPAMCSPPSAFTAMPPRCRRW